MNSPKNKTPQELWPDSILVRKSLTTPFWRRSRRNPNLQLLPLQQPPISRLLLCFLIQTMAQANLDFRLWFLVLATALQAANTVIAVFYN